jgi:hypothetical protein
MINVLLNNVDQSIAADWISRSERSMFVKSISKSKACKKILNVGSGGKRDLANIVDTNTIVFDIDMAGDCDLKLNLDHIKTLPFADGEYDMVCAMDVLEHLENFHHINNELFRVSSRCILISLPNSATEFLQVALGRTDPGPKEERGFFSKYYGLPLTPPADRHRWWLYPSDIVRFYENFAIAKGCRVTYFIPKAGFFRSIVRLVLGSNLYYTFFLPHVAILLEKRS